MHYLKDDFSIDRYGMHVRFVTVEDAAFILEIRTNSKNGRFIHDTSPCLDDQIEYIKKYKEKEKNGMEYYFMFEKDDVPQGVYRIYDRTDTYCNIGSWVFSPEADKFSALKAHIITPEIVFDDLGYSFIKSSDGVNKKNTNVVNATRIIGAIFDENCRLEPKGEYLTYVVHKNSFYEQRKKILRFCGFAPYDNK